MYPTLARIGTLTTLLTLLSCSTSSTESDDWETADVVNVAFKLSVYEGGTRSGNDTNNSDDTSSANVTEGPTWGDTYTNETLYYDAAIDPSTVKVYLTDETGTSILTDITPLICYKEEGEDNLYTYYGYAGKAAFNTLKNGTTLRCMVTANATSATYSLTDLPDGDTKDNEELYIPMWGVGSFTLDQSTRNQTVEEIALLRAAVKCRVKLSEEMSQSYTLSNVTLHPAIATGHVYPTGYNQVSATEDLYFLKDDDSKDLYGFHPYDEAIDTLLTQSFLEDPSNTDTTPTAWIAYFPEYTNNETNPIYISLSLNKGTTTTTHTIAFKDYDNDALYTDLMRNHLYDFTITGIGRSMDLTLEVSDWSTPNMKWDLTKELSTESIRWVEDTYSTVDQSEKTVTVLSGVAATGNFHIQTPVGVTWYATLTSEDYRPFVFVDAAGNEGTTVTSGEIDGTSPSTLRIKATTPNNTLQHKATLTLYIEYKDGTTRKVEELSGWTIIQTL